MSGLGIYVLSAIWYFIAAKCQNMKCIYAVHLLLTLAHSLSESIIVTMKFILNRKGKRLNK